MASKMSGAVVAVLALLVAPESIAAQNFPTKTIQLVVGFPPGGSVDAVARIVADRMSKELGQTVVVETKTGATGIVAANTVATSKPDGYTILLAPGGHALYGATLKSLPFDPVNSFSWISNIVTSPFFITVAATSPYTSMADLIAKAKSGQTVKFGSVGIGSPHHLGVELVGLATGTKFVHVPYRGEGPILAALQGGEIDFAILTPVTVVGQVQSGAVRALAATTNIRSSRLPDVPTVEEALKLKDFNIGSWYALAVAANTPEPILARLNAALRVTLKDADTLRRLEPIGGELVLSSPQEQRDRVAREAATWAKIVDAAGVEKQ